jgi:mannose-6-phosphate isomerase-like protein (cupin superfamily)
MATNSVSLDLCSRFPSNVNLGGNHAVQDNRTTVARRAGASRRRSRANHPRFTGNYTNIGRRNQTADRHGRAAPFQSGEHRSSAGREERRLAGQRHPLPDVGIERGLVDGEAKMLNAGEGLFIAGGKTATLTAGSGRPSTFLHFFLAPAMDLGRPAETAPAAVRKLYRTANPIPDLKPGGYDLNLTRVTFPAPSNPPHHRSGAALYYVISGTGANTIDGKTEARGPASLIYEPYALAHQWGNPGNEPLIFLAFNINPEGVAAVLPDAPATNP